MFICIYIYIYIYRMGNYGQDLKLFKKVYVREKVSKLHFTTNKTGKKEHFFLVNRKTTPNIWTIKTRDCNILLAYFIYSFSF